MRTRIIAKLDVKPPYVVKPIHFEALRKIDTPVNLAKKYYEQGADELFYIDIVASLYRRKILNNYIKKAASELFIPFAVGGGVKTVNDFSKLLHIGADKIIINTHAVQIDPDIINKSAEIFGSQAIVVNIEAKKWDSHWECFTDCGRIQSSKNVLDWVLEVERRGAGEILLQSVDCDGAQKGFDIELAQAVIPSVDIPVVISSGAGCLEDIKNLIEEANPSGIAIASLLHYDKVTIQEIKKYLGNHGIEVSK